MTPNEIIENLMKLPVELFNLDLEAAKDGSELDELKESLELAKINASLGAPQDGPNADARKLQLQAAIANDPDVKRVKAAIATCEAAKIETEAQQKMLARQFSAFCHICELSTAQLNMLAMKSRSGSGG